MGYENDRGRYGRPNRGYGDRDRQGEASRYQGGREGRDFDDDRGFLDRAGDEVRSWFGDEEAERRRRYDEQNEERTGGYRGGDDRGYSGQSGRQGYGATGQGGARGHEAGGFTRNEHDHQHEPHYREWRDRQIADLDRDYHDYRRENQSRFEQEFGSWRTTRQGQRESIKQAREHQEVVGSDGEHVGTVDKVRGDRIILTKADQDAGGHHHSIPSSWVTKVGDKVEISKTAEQAKAAWRDEEEQGGLFGGERQYQQGRQPDDDRGVRNLNRSFSGS